MVVVLVSARGQRRSVKRVMKSSTSVELTLGIRSDRTDRFGSSVIRSVRSSETWDRSVFAKNEDRGSSVSVSSVRSRSRPN